MAESSRYLAILSEVDPDTALIDVENEIGGLLEHLTDLRRQGVLLLGAAGKNGAELVAWLQNTGLSHASASLLIADIIRARRAAQRVTDGESGS